MDDALAKAEAALEFLSQTDEKYGKSKANVKRAQFLVGRKEAIEFLSAEGTKDKKLSVAERQALAKTSESVMGAEKTLTNCMEQYEILNAQRATQTLIFEFWRSLNSARKQGVQV